MKLYKKAFLGLTLGFAGLSLVAAPYAGPVRVEMPKDPAPIVEMQKAQEKEKKRKPKYKSLREYKKSQNKKKEPAVKPKTGIKTNTQGLTSIVNEQSLPKITLRVERADGSLYGNFIIQDTQKEGTYVIDPNNQKLKTLPLPKNAVIFLETKSPFKDYRIDMMMDDGTKTNTKLINPETGEAVHFHHIDTSVYNLKAGTSDDLEILLEPKKQEASVVVHYRIIDLGIPANLEEHKTITKKTKLEKHDPTQAIDKIAKSFVQHPNEEKKKEKVHHPKKEKTQHIIEVKGGFVLESENAIIKEIDPPRTGSGILVEGVFASEDYQAWGTFLNLTYDDRLLVPGGAQLKNVLRQTNAGAEYKIGPFVLGIEYIHTDKEWVANRAHLMSPQMNKYTYDGFFAGGGIALGDFNDSFIELLGYYGKGTLKEKISVPGSYYLDNLTVDSDGLTEWFGKIHGKFINDTIYLEGTGSFGKYNDTEKILEGTRLTYGGKLGIHLGKISKSLNNCYAGFIFNGFDMKDNNVELKETIWGPWVTIRF